MSLLFVIFIVFIFPAAKRILHTANTYKNIKKEIDELNYDKFNAILNHQNDKFSSDSNRPTMLIIRDELINSVRECDFETYSIILEELNDKTIGLISNGDDSKKTENIFYCTTFIWNAGKFVAL